MAPYSLSSVMQLFRGLRSQIGVKDEIYTLNAQSSLCTNFRLCVHKHFSLAARIKILILRRV